MLYLPYYNLLIMIRGNLIYKLTLFVYLFFQLYIYNSNLYNLCENVVVVGNKSFFFFFFFFLSGWWSPRQLHIPVRTGRIFYFPWHSHRHQIEGTDGFY